MECKHYLPFSSLFSTKINAIFIFNSKVVVTKNGCMMNMISKGEKCTIKSVMKRTKNFLLMVSLKSYAYLYKEKYQMK